MSGTNLLQHFYINNQAEPRAVMQRLDDWSAQIENRLVAVERRLSPSTPKTNQAHPKRRYLGTVDPDRLEQKDEEDEEVSAPEDSGYHYVALLDCGHWIELTRSWNTVIDNPSPGWPTPKNAYCSPCSLDQQKIGMKGVVKFAKVYE